MQMSRPITPYFAFLKEKREKGPVTTKEGGKLWAKLTSKEKERYISDYRKKADEYEKYMLSQGFNPVATTSARGPKLSPIGKGIPDHVRSKRVRVVCSKTGGILPASKSVYKGLGKTLGVFIEHIGKAIENQRKKRWESIMTIDLVYKAITESKEFDKITSKAQIN